MRSSCHSVAVERLTTGRARIRVKRRLGGEIAAELSPADALAVGQALIWIGDSRRGGAVRPT